MGRPVRRHGTGQTTATHHVIRCCDPSRCASSVQRGVATDHVGRCPLPPLLRVRRDDHHLLPSRPRRRSRQRTASCGAVGHRPRGKRVRGSQTSGQTGSLPPAAARGNGPWRGGVRRSGAAGSGPNFFWPRPATNSPSTANQRPIKEPPAVPLARVGVWPRAAAAGGGRSRNSSPLCRGTRGAADPGISPRLRRRVGIPGRQLNPPPGTSAGCRRPPPSARGPTPGLWSARALGLRAAGQRLGGWRHARPCVCGTTSPCCEGRT